MHGAGGGAPNGNKNALKHGRYTAAKLMQDRLLKTVLKIARQTLAEI